MIPQKSRLPPDEQPQSYEHRVEMAIMALHHTLEGARKIVLFLSEEQGTNWPCYPLLAEAADEFQHARRRLRRARSNRR